MIQLIKKGGLRERANRSRSYKGSENTETVLEPNRYRTESSALQNRCEEDQKPQAPADAKKIPD